MFAARPVVLAALVLALGGWGVQAGRTEKPLLGAYYYTWYGVGEQWEVFPRTFEPQLGMYKSAEKKVMTQHHKWAREADIDFLAVSWGGDGTRSAYQSHQENLEPAGSCELVNAKGGHVFPKCVRKDGNGTGKVPPQNKETYTVEGWEEPMLYWKPSGDIDKLIMTHLDVQNGVPMALMYELRDVLGVGEGQGSVNLTWGSNPQILEHHLKYAADHFFKHPNYFRINGCPVLILYTLRDYQDYVIPLQTIFEKVAKEIGMPLYIIGDMVWWSPSDPEDYDWKGYKEINVSAVTAYNLFDWGQPDKMTGAFGFHCASRFETIFGKASLHDIQVLPYVSPGYDDRKMRGAERPFLPRADGAQYVESWKQMRWFTKCQGKETNQRPIVMLNSFNEWHEGTQIEPSLEHNDSYIRWTRQIKEAIHTSEASALAEYQCDDNDVVSISGSNEEDTARQASILLGMHHWDPQVRAAARKAQGKKATSKWGKKGTVLGLASVWPSTAVVLWIAARNIKGHSFLMASIFLVALAFGSSMFLASEISPLTNDPLGQIEDNLRGLQKEIMAAALVKFDELMRCDKFMAERSEWVIRAARGPAYGMIKDCFAGLTVERVKALYMLVLGRQADEHGMNLYCTKMDDGKLTRVAAIEKMLKSDEGQDYALSLAKDYAVYANKASGLEEEEMGAFKLVRKAYITCLGRPFDNGGMQGYMGAVANGLTEEALFKDLCRSDEAKNFKQTKVWFP